MPEELLIYEQGGELKPYHKTSIDDFLKGLGARVGVELSNHDLRRTCGRMMYRAEIRIEAIARIFGHADTRTTIRYLGLDFEDMSSSMKQYAQYQNTVVPQMVQSEESQIKGGPIGI